MIITQEIILPRLESSVLMTLSKALALSVCLIIGALIPPEALVGQATDARRAQATRAELESALSEIDQVISSPGYSGRVKNAKRREADLIRRRLSDGDFQAGDMLALVVVGEPTLTAQFTVRTGQVLVLPQMPEIPLRGVLRTELRDHLVTQLAQYIRNPQVDVQDAGIRLAILGAVAQPGFYTVPAEKVPSEAIMLASGPTAGADITKMVIRRDGREIVGKEEVRQAIIAGLSLDQLNVHGGDEIFVPGTSKVGTANILTITQIVTGLGFAVFSLSRIF